MYHLHVEENGFGVYVHEERKMSKMSEENKARLY